MGKDNVQFLASFPSIQSAFKRHGGGNGLRIQLDIPEQHVSEAVKLMALTQCVLKVTVEVAEKNNGQQSEHREIHI